MRLVFFGPPGGGKGTQAQRVAKDAKSIHIATGDLLRDAVKNGTPAGKKAQEHMGKGGLVPDEIVNEVLQERIAKPDAKDGYLLDGYPRTQAQATSLDVLLDSMKMPVEKRIFIDVPFSAIEERVLGRRTCKKCQASYHVKFNPSKKGDRCEKIVDGAPCDGELYQRADDSAEKLKTRLDAYTKDTLPVIQSLQKQGKIVTVDAGTKGLDEVEALVRQALGLPKKK